MTATSKRWWPRSVARVGRLIGRLYRWRLGWLFGHRFALLTHEGRRSGKTYRTALWVYRYQPGTGQVTVVSVWGDSDWYRNIRSKPAALLQVGRRSFAPEQQFLSTDDIAAIETEFRREHRWIARGQSLLMHWPWPATDVQLKTMCEQMRAVAFSPARQGMSTRARLRDEHPGRPLAFDLSVAIGRPPAAVFAFLADVQEHTGAGIRMTKIPLGLTAVGTRWHEHVRLLPGWWMTMDSIVTEIDQPAVLGMDFRSIWCTGHLTYTIEATPQGSILHQQETLRPRWPLRPLAAWIDAGLRPRLLARLAEMRALLESP